jgi:hypothetical protein
VSYSVAIRRNDTGEIRISRHDYEWDTDGSDYLWTEGNFSCDCNRYLFFQRAAGEDEGEHSCGDSLYTVLYAELPTGERIPIDTDDGQQ